MKTLSIIACAACSLVVAACGGGGGGGGGGNPPPTAGPAMVSVSAANATAAAGAVFDANQMLAQPGPAAGVVTGASVSVTGKGFSLADLARNELLKFALGQAAGTVVATGAQIVGTKICSGGGSALVTLNDNDGNANISTGDTATLVFTNCVEAGATMNGSVGLTNVSVTGDPNMATGTLSLGSTFTLNNFSVVDGADTFTTNGAFNLTISLDQAHVNATTAISGTSLGIVRNGVNLTLTDFSATLTDNLSTDAFTYQSKGTVNSSRLNGAVTFDTLTPFHGTGSDFPSGGVFKAVGANGTSVTLTTVDNTRVTLGIDANGDGQVDSTLDRTWAEIDAA